MAAHTKKVLVSLDEISFMSLPPWQFLSFSPQNHKVQRKLALNEHMPICYVLGILFVLSSKLFMISLPTSFPITLPSQSIFIPISQKHLKDINGQTDAQWVFWVLIIVIVPSLEFHDGLLKLTLGLHLTQETTHGHRNSSKYLRGNRNPSRRSPGQEAPAFCFQSIYKWTYWQESRNMRAASQPAKEF